MIKYTPRKVWKKKKKNKKEPHQRWCGEKKKMNKAELGERVKAIREHYGLPQPLFAKQINKTQGFVSNVETGRSGVSEETIKEICFLFGVNKEWLVSGVGEMGCGDAADKAGIDKRIKEIRKEARQTQEEFGKKIGYSKRQVYCVESGKVNPSRQYLRKIATTFSVNFDWLLTGKGKKEMKEVEVSEELISWLRKNPDVVEELEIRSGVKKSTPEK